VTVSKIFLNDSTNIFKLVEITLNINKTIVRFEIFTEVTMKNAVFWDVAPCRYCINRRFGRTYRLHLPGRRKKKNPPSEEPAICSSETLVYTISTRRHITEDGILQIKQLFIFLCFIFIIPHQSWNFIARPCICGSGEHEILLRMSWIAYDTVGFFNLSFSFSILYGTILFVSVFVKNFHESFQPPFNIMQLQAVIRDP
jgi:hypothetical protein